MLDKRERAAAAVKEDAVPWQCQLAQESGMDFEITNPGIFFAAFQMAFRCTVMTMKHGTSTVKDSMPDQFNNEIRSTWTMCQRGAMFSLFSFQEGQFSRWAK